MKTISILIRTDTGTDEKREVPAAQFFDLYGFTFAVHRPYESRTDWKASETTTGLLITSGLTQKEVIKEARKRLKKAGKGEVCNAVKQALKAQKEGKEYVGN